MALKTELVNWSVRSDSYYLINQALREGLKAMVSKPVNWK